jgi:hypothetical protein
MASEPNQSETLWQLGLACSAIFALITGGIKFLFNRTVNTHDEKLKQIDDHLEATDERVESLTRNHAALELMITKNLGEMELRLTNAINNKRP